MHYRNFLMAGAMAALAMTSPAAAAPVPAITDASGRALILIPLTLTKVDDLNFGSVIPSSASGSVSIAANGSGRTMTGGVTPYVTDPGSRGLIAGAGAAGQQVNMFLAPPLTLDDGAGHSMPIAMNLESTKVTIGPSRAFFVGIGGTVTVGANQAEGIYTGIFTVLAQYN